MIAKRLTAFAAALALCFVAGPAAGAETADPAVSAAEQTESFAEEAEGFTLPVSLPEGMTADELSEGLQKALNVLSSEEFQDLISHQEVRDLIALVVTRGAEFAENEPDLVREILRTLGVGEDVLAALSFLAANSGEIKAIAGDFLTGENGEALRTYLEGFFGSEDMALLLDAISAAASGQQNAAPDSAAEPVAEGA